MMQEVPKLFLPSAEVVCKMNIGLFRKILQLKISKKIKILSNHYYYMMEKIIK